MAVQDGLRKYVVAFERKVMLFKRCCCSGALFFCFANMPTPTEPGDMSNVELPKRLTEFFILKSDDLNDDLLGRILRAYNCLRQHPPTVYKNSPSEGEYEHLITVYGDAGEGHVTWFLKLLRDYQNDLLQQTTVSGLVQEPTSAVSTSSVPDLVQEPTAIVEPPSIQSIPRQPPPAIEHTTPVEFTSASDELDYGPPTEPTTPQRRCTPPLQAVSHNATIYPTEALISLLYPVDQVILKGGKKIIAEECNNIVRVLKEFVTDPNLNVPLVELADKIYAKKDSFQKNGDKSIRGARKVCELFYTALSRVTKDNVNEVFDTVVSPQDALSIVKRCLGVMDEIRVADRSRTLALDTNTPLTRISWTKLHNKVYDLLKKRASDIRNGPHPVDDGELQQAARLGLYVLEGGGPRYREYRTLIADCQGTNQGTNTYIKGKIILCDYAAAKQYGTYDFDVSQVTQTILDELVQRNAERNADRIEPYYILSDQKMSIEAWKELCSKDINRIWDRGSGTVLTSTHLCYSYIYDLKRQHKLETVVSKARLARSIGIAFDDVEMYMSLKARTRASKRPRSRASSSSGHTTKRYRRSESRVTDGDRDGVDDDLTSLESGETRET